jgi:hypothetical protein
MTETQAEREVRPFPIETVQFVTLYHEASDKRVLSSAPTSGQFFGPSLLPLAGALVPDKRRSQSQPRARKGQKDESARQEDEPARRSKQQKDVTVPRQPQFSDADDEDKQALKRVTEQLREERSELLARCLSVMYVSNRVCSHLLLPVACSC